MKMPNKIRSQPKAQIFISYAREDKDFVLNLCRLFDANPKHQELWIDWEGIPLTSQWWPEIIKAIDRSAIFLFICTVASIRSSVCKKEIEHAISNHKKIIILLPQPIDEKDCPDEIKKYQWLFWIPDNSTESIKLLQKAIEIDLEWNAYHAFFLALSDLWLQGNKEKSLQLRGRELIRAEEWLDKADSFKNQVPTINEVEFIFRSRKGAAKRFLSIALLMLLLVFLHGVISQRAGISLVTPVSPVGMVNFEMSRDPDKVQMLRLFSNTDSVELSLLLDFEFIVLYTSLLGFLLIYFVTALKRRIKILSRIGIFLFIAVILAALGDVAENIMIWQTFAGNSNQNFMSVSYFVTLAKTILIFLTVLYLTIAYLLSLFINRKAYRKKG